MRKNYFYRAVLFFVCMLLPAVSGSAKAPLGTPTREALLQLAWDCLEEYNFCDIHMNLAAGRGKSTETTAAEMDDLPMDSADVVTDDSGEAFVPQQYIMVGDSRFVGMQQAVGDAGCVWIGQVSAGLDWFANTAVPEIDAVVGDGSVIIINMGVNDLGNVWGYLDILNQKVPQWLEKGAVVYYMSVNPVESHPYISNDDIANFNNILYNNMPPEVGWIETYSYLLEYGYGTQDGVHFDTGTYQTIFYYTMEVLAGFTA